MTARSDEKVRGQSWWLVPVGLLVAMVAGEAWMVRVAVVDPGFALERDYYKKAIQWDATQEQQAENEKLGWRIGLETAPAPGDRVQLRVALRDRQGRTLHGAKLGVQTFFNARADDIFQAELEEAADGSYGARMPLKRRGLWEFRFTAMKDGVRFTDVVRRDLDPRGGA